jgi:hypothetical protein
VNHAEEKLARLFEIAEDTALANGRELVYWHDLPITGGLRETMHELERLADRLPDAAAIEAYLRDAGILSGLDVEARDRLPRLFGALLVIDGRAIAMLTPRGLTTSERLSWLNRRDPEQPVSEEVERAERILNLAL